MGVRREPALTVGKERLELLRRKHLLALLLKQQTEILQLGVVHALVVDLRQSVQLLAQHLEAVCLQLVVQSGQLAQVGVLRMQGEDRYA